MKKETLLQNETAPQSRMAQKKAAVRFITYGAVLIAISYALTLLPGFSIFPAAPFLSYDPKDIVIALGGLMFGPIMPVMVSVVVALLEMVTISATGPIGCIMNVLSTCAFACTTALIYKKRRSLSGAVIGLACGVATMSVVMVLWNWLITPLYMGVPREAIVNMLLPVFLPFNLLKGGINATFTFLLYKPVVGALRRARLLPAMDGAGEKRKNSVWFAIVALLILITCVLIILIIKGII